MQKRQKSVKKRSPWELDASTLGDFSRARILDILKQPPDSKSTVVVTMAATLLASLVPDGPRRDEVATAMEALARAGTPLAQRLLWQAAEHAAHARIRVEAIRRCGPFAVLGQWELLRKWASEGFAPIVCSQHDQVTVDCIREAALAALGDLRRPGAEEIATVVAALAPPSDQKKFSERVFDAAAEAYWKIGDPDSLSDVAAFFGQRLPPGVGLTLVALAARFSDSELKPYAEVLCKAFQAHAPQWADHRDRTSRLDTLAQKLATPAFLKDWTSRYSCDGLEQGRGKITATLLRATKERTADVAIALLALAQWGGNLSADSLVMKGLAESVRAGHGKLIVKSIIEQHHDGHRSLVESGVVLELYGTPQPALADICEFLSEIHAGNRQQLASRVARGIVTAAARVALPNEEIDADAKAFTGNNARRDAKDNQEDLPRIVQAVGQLDRLRNPVAIVAALLCPPTSSEGALSIVEKWLGWDSALADYVVRSVIREAGRSGACGQEAPMLGRFEQLLLPPQQPLPRKAFETALVDEIMLGDRLNRYALDTTQRANLSFSTAARTALNQLQSRDDAQFLLDRLHAAGTAGIEVLRHGMAFHRDGDSSLTEFVRKTAIALATDVLIAGGEQKQREDHARQLHEAFYDVPAVRIAAYRACGELGILLSVRALRQRQAKENNASAKTAIGTALASLRDRLVQRKPQLEASEDLKSWLGCVGDLGDSSLLSQAAGYLIPPHRDQTVCRSALIALAAIGVPEALGVVTKFIEETNPEGETLAVARRTRILLEKRSDADLFDVLARFFAPDADVMDPTINYEQLLGGASLVQSTTKALQKAQLFWEQDHWDEFITKTSGVIEALVKQVVRTHYAKIKRGQPEAEKLARGGLASILNASEFKSAFGNLQAHANTIYRVRHAVPTAHVMNEDGTPKSEATEENAEYIRDEFLHAFTEAVKALR